MYLHIIGEQINQYDTIPVKIRLADGMTRTSLNELSVPEQESLGLFEYQDITPGFDAMLKTWHGEYQYDHDARTAEKILADRPIEEIKAQINTTCQSTILAKFSIIHQLDVANGLYADNGMKVWIAAMVAESNRCTDLVDLAQPAVPVWPEYVEVV